MKSFIHFCLFFLLSVGLFGQRSKPTPPVGSTPTIIDKGTIQLAPRANYSTAQQTNANQVQVDYQNLPALQLAASGDGHFQLFRNPKTGMATWISGQSPNANTTTALNIQAKAVDYLKAVRTHLQVHSPEEEFITKSIFTDDLQQSHIRMQQVFQGIKVYGSEIVLHEKAGAINLFNGYYFPSPTLPTLQASINAEQAEQIVRTDLNETTPFVTLDAQQLKWVDGPQIQSELVIYHVDGQLDAEKLVWHIQAIPNISKRWEYFVDANDGTIWEQFNTVCQLHGWHPDHHQCSAHSLKKEEPTASPKQSTLMGPVTANATDLQGNLRTINVWEESNFYVLVDASRDMFDASASSMPQDPIGAIITLDAQNVWPIGNVIFITSGNNTWSQKAVSAHYNAGVAYEYFKSTFGRTSIKDQGENIISIINVPDENNNDFDNAFWNGAAIFYGNGDQVFNAPLAKATDVAGHEMSHGVVQSTANLVYQNESGALNESFADIFGAMIDRDDWQIGEEIANPAFYPTGTMRDMANPNNGGNSSNFYWQPAKYSERFTGSGDNGGVHINSGIPNHAYYLFATNPSVGKAKAEQVFYRVLRDYMVMSSQFVDLRIAVLEATTQMYGANSPEFNAAAAAFDQVEIFGEQGGNYQNDIPSNPGDDFVLWSDENSSNINNSLPDNGAFLSTFSNANHISKPSITDDGSIIVYVGSDGSLWEVDIDWSTGVPQITNEFPLEETLDWRNVVSSKDGSKIAAIYGDLSQGIFDNEIFVFDFVSGTSRWFKLSNPTFSTGVSTGDVQYADALEWDASGQYILYDAFNRIQNSSGPDIEYWDIGIVKVWDNATNSFEDGLEPPISKIFNTLPEDVSIGNPTFAKNSPYIIAFDYISSSFFGTEYEVRGVNIQTGDWGLIFENNTLGYPNFSVEDDRLLFSVVNNGIDILGFSNLNPDKISSNDDAFVLVNNARWGVYYANGERVLTSTEAPNALDQDLHVFPNPVEDQLQLELTTQEATTLQVSVIDLLGKLVHKADFQLHRGDHQLSLSLGHLPQGTYTLQLQYEGQQASRMIVRW